MNAYRAYEQTLDGGLKQVCLANADCQLAILPAAGFNLYSAIYKNRQLLMPTVNIANPMSAAGVPILFPMPNRTRDCQYTFGGHSCQIKKNGQPRFLHGLFMDEPFNYSFGADETSAWCKGWASISSDKEYFDSYPFPCTLTLVYTLTAGGLKLTYTVQNEGGETLPYGFAIHPYFDKMGQPDKIRIQVPAPSYYEAEMCMPTGKLLPAQNETDISEFKAVADLNLDHVFSGMSGKKACIAYDELGFGLELSASKEFVNMVVYTPQNRPGFCLENQTNATDFLNLYAKGIDTAFMNTVEPGQTASGWIEIKVV